VTFSPSKGGGRFYRFLFSSPQPVDFPTQARVVAASLNFIRFVFFPFRAARNVPPEAGNWEEGWSSQLLNRGQIATA